MKALAVSSTTSGLAALVCGIVLMVPPPARELWTLLDVIRWLVFLPFCMMTPVLATGGLVTGVLGVWRGPNRWQPAVALVLWCGAWAAWAYVQFFQK